MHRYKDNLKRIRMMTSQLYWIFAKHGVNMWIVFLMCHAECEKSTKTLWHLQILNMNASQFVLSWKTSEHPHIHCRKFSFQTFPAAFSHLNLTAMRCINQKVVLCYFTQHPHCFEKAEPNRTGDISSGVIKIKYTKRGKRKVFMCGKNTTVN